VSIPAAAESEEMIFDKYESEFNELISLSKELLERQPVGISDDEQTSPFTFGTGVIACLHITITQCRYHVLCREALRLLEIHQRREGVWDSAMVGAIGRWVMATEEQGLEAGEHIPESVRLRMVEVKSPCSKRKALIKCTKMERAIPQ
jgi:hypothetical protein